MFTTELTVILPIVVLLLFSLIAIGFYLTELVQTMLFVERAFVDFLVNQGERDTQNDAFNITVEVDDYGAFKYFDVIHVHTIENPFSELMKSNTFEYKNSFEALQYSRLILRHMIKGGELIFETK